MNDERTSAGIEDLLAEEDEQTFIHEAVNLKTGAGGNLKPEKRQENTQNPNATRWMFNPFEVIDLRNEPTSCGMAFLDNVVFNRVRSLDVNMGKDIRDTTSNPVNPLHNVSNYTKFTRTAYMIARELTEKHGDKGVIDIPELMGEEEGAADLNRLLFGENVECVVDINNPDHPCPVLPNLLEVLHSNFAENVKLMGDKERADFTAVANSVRKAIGLAIRNCRLRIEIAQKRLLDKKNPNRYLSHAEQRCYIALGEEIPNQMPLLTKSAHAGSQVSGDAIAQAVVAGVNAAMGSKALEPEAPKGFVSTDRLDDLETKAKTDFSVDDVDIEPKKKK